MCGFIFSYSPEKYSDNVLNKAEKFIKKRGPTSYSRKTINTMNGKVVQFAHYLLDVSGQSAVQPAQIFSNEGTLLFTLLFNGEIYNYKELVEETTSDTDTLSFFLRNKGEIPFDDLDGEYTIVVYNHINHSVTVATDQFMTKPVTFGWSLNKENFGVASYPSALAELGLTNIYYATPNCSTFFDLDHPDTWRIPSSKPADGDETYRYNTLQVNNDFFGWEKSFFDSVKKRALHGSLPIFVPLSSGYDSGSICLALNELNVPYRSISIDSEENQEILAERIKINLRSSFVEHINLPALTQDECLEIKHMIENQCEPFKYIHSDQSLLDDDGALGAFRVATEAHRRGLLVCLSGCGADEIISDYGFNGIKHYPHSEFGGLFPDNLDTIFPWKKFYEDTMRSYLFKDELIFGIFGIEGRYPFLDRSLTQEFLSLSSKLKNSEYKSPITYILKKYHYPFEEGVKRGFSPYIKSNQNKSKNEIFKICFFEKLRKVIELIRKEK